MRKKQLLFFLCLIILCLSLYFFALAANGDTIVYVTDTGEKYHSYGCGYLKSSHSITLQEAVDRGYTPCSRCSPPRLDKSSTTESNDRTTNNSSFSSYTPPQSSNSYTEPKVVYETVYETVTEIKEVPYTPNYIVIIIVVLVIVSATAIVIASCNGSTLSKERTEHNKRVSELESTHKNELRKTEQQFKTDMFIMLKSLERKSHVDVNDINSYLYMPEKCFVGNDGLPAIEDGSRHKWGERYTFYISHPEGVRQKYHKPSCRYAARRFEINAYTIERTGIYSPCLTCKPKLPNMDWVEYHHRIKDIADKYDFFVDDKEV